MHGTYTVSVRLAEEEAPDECLGLLLPVPPCSGDQELREVRLDERWKTQHLVAQGGIQRAMLAWTPSGDYSKPMEFEIELRPGRLVAEHFIERSGASTDPQADARQVFADLRLPSGCSPAEKLRRIVDCITHKYDYGHDFRTDLPLTCDRLRGNCLDINAALIRLLRLAGVPHAYYIGFFFEEAKYVGGRHCWVSTLVDGHQEDWDIAHHLRQNAMQVNSALNPLPGIRFAMSTGWDLAFDLPSGLLKVPHLATPRWVFVDGTTVDCPVNVSYIQRTSRDDLTSAPAAPSAVVSLAA